MKLRPKAILSRSGQRLRGRFLGLVAVMALIEAACAGPGVPLEVGMKEYPTDVILGAQVQPPALPPVSNPSITTFAFVPPPVVIGRPLVVTPVPAACPSAHPFTAPKHEARNRAINPPVPGTYVFRNKGTYEYSKLTPPKGSLPTQSTRTIKDVKKDTDDPTRYSFTVVEDLGGAVTTTTFHVIPTATIEGDQGIYITQMTTKLQDGSSDVFAPRPEIKIMGFPAEPGASWTSSGTSTTGSGDSEALKGRVGLDIPGQPTQLQAKARVDACGEPLDALYVLIGGPPAVPTDPPDPAGAVIVGPNRNLRLKAIYAFATQYGGFSIYEKIELSGTIGGVPIKITSEATISEVPEFPRP